MKNFKIKLQRKDLEPEGEEFIYIVKTIPGKSKKHALEIIQTYEFINLYNVVSCEERK